MSTTDTKSTQLLTGLFDDRASVENAYQETLAHGYQPKDINIIMSDETRKRYFADGTHNIKIEEGDKSIEGLALGGTLGGTVVGIVGAIAAIGTALVIPGLGLVIAGPLAAGLAGAGAGGIAGGLLGALIGWGIPEEQVKEYEAGIKSGGIVMAVHPRSVQDSRDLSTRWEKYRSDKSSF
jgi:hypothetical protein